MPQHPVDHVAAIGTSGSGHSVRIGIRQGRYVVHDSHDVVVYFPTPIVPNVFGEFLAVTIRSPGIWHDNQVPSRCENLSVPTVGPTLAPIAFGPAVDQK